MSDDACQVEKKELPTTGWKVFQQELQGIKLIPFITSEK